MEVIEPVAPELAAASLGVGLGSEGVSEDAVASEGHPKEDPGLVAAALPYSVIKRIVRTASPGVSFDREAIAGFARIAQAFALFATDGALAELSKEAEKVKKSGKSKSNAPPVRSLKTLTADHVMRFLTAELPPIATKVASLFPDLMPGDFKPAGVQLLEKLGEQSKFAAQASPQKGVAPSGRVQAFSARLRLLRPARSGLLVAALSRQARSLAAGLLQSLLQLLPVIVHSVLPQRHPPRRRRQSRRRLWHLLLGVRRFPTFSEHPARRRGQLLRSRQR